MTRWSAWKTVRWTVTALEADRALDEVNRLHHLADVGIFFAGKRLTYEQLRTRAAAEQREIDKRIYGEPDDSKEPAK